MMTIESRERLLDTKKAATYLTLSPHTLDRWRWSGEGPRYIKLGRSIRYLQDDLDLYIKQSLRKHKSEDSSKNKAFYGDRNARIATRENNKEAH